MAERNFAVEGNDLSGYLGCDPEYMTYANESERPYAAEGDVVHERMKANPPDQVTFTNYPVEWLDDPESAPTPVQDELVKTEVSINQKKKSK